MHLFKLLLIFIISTFLFSCISNIRPEGSFIAIQIVNGEQRLISFNADKIKTTENTIVYLQEGYSASDDFVNTITSGFEDIYNKTVDIFGNHTDVDNNGKVIIMLLDINAGVISSGGYTAGYFYPNDLLRGRGNDAEILYIDVINNANLTPSGIENLKGLMAHEFQHLINFNNNFVKKGSSSEIWINEALSESADILSRNGNMSTSRLSIFNTYNDSIKLGNYFYVWDDTLVDYATASLFMYWLYVNGGEDFIKDIASSTHSYDYRGIINAAEKNSFLYGQNWEDIMVNWFKGNFDASTSYNNTITIDGMNNKILNNFSSIKLYPGSVIYTDSEFTSSDTSKIHVDSIGTTKVIFNKDTDINGSPVTISKRGNFRNSTVTNYDFRELEKHRIIDDDNRMLHAPSDIYEIK